MPSTVIRRFAYRRPERALDIEFVTGRVYRYLAVPEREARGLAGARSKGGWFNRRIRDRFAFVRLLEWPAVAALGGQELDAGGYSTGRRVAAPPRRSARNEAGAAPFDSGARHDAGDHPKIERRPPMNHQNDGNRAQQQSGDGRSQQQGQQSQSQGREGQAGSAGGSGQFEQERREPGQVEQGDAGSGGDTGAPAGYGDRGQGGSGTSGQPEQGEWDRAEQSGDAAGGDRARQAEQAEGSRSQSSSSGSGSRGNDSGFGQE